MKRLIAVLAIAALLAGCSSANLNDVKTHAVDVWRQAGFEVIGYQGYNLGGYLGGTSYGGAYVWYTVRRNNITYQGSIQRWGNEYHIYSLKALDAIGTQE